VLLILTNHENNQGVATRQEEPINGCVSASINLKHLFHRLRGSATKISVYLSFWLFYLMGRAFLFFQTLNAVTVLAVLDRMVGLLQSYGNQCFSGEV
jgi:hypothetical protein